MKKEEEAIVMAATEIVVTQGTADKLWYYGNENTDSWTGPFDTREEAENHLADLRQRYEEFKKRLMQTEVWFSHLVT